LPILRGKAEPWPMIGTHVVSPREPGVILVSTARGARSRAFRTPEAGDNLIGAALAHCRRIAAMVAERSRRAHVWGRNVADSGKEAPWEI
jgi:hypothetical protein